MLLVSFSFGHGSFVNAGCEVWRQSCLTTEKQLEGKDVGDKAKKRGGHGRWWSFVLSNDVGIFRLQKAKII